MRYLSPANRPEGAAKGVVAIRPPPRRVLQDPPSVERCRTLCRVQSFLVPPSETDGGGAVASLLEPLLAACGTEPLGSLHQIRLICGSGSVERVCHAITGAGHPAFDAVPS
jgi:hypothetical protein